MFITGLGVAVPPQRYSQADCWTALQASQAFATLTPRSRAILKKVLTGENRISSRHLALTPLAQAFEISPDALHARFLQHAPVLAHQAAQHALVDAHIDPRQIDALIVSTCTGYLCPGLSSYAAESLGLRPDILALDLVGQGCGAAVPNLRMADALIQSRRSAHVLSITLEVCSAAFYLDNDPGVLISACLFGDGAAAAVLSAAPRPGSRCVEWKHDGSVLVPAARDLLRFETRNGMLRNILSPEVPQLAARHAKQVFSDVTTAAGVTPSEIKEWIFHAGGREVLKALQEHFALPDRAVRHSAKQDS